MMPAPVREVHRLRPYRRQVLVLTGVGVGAGVAWRLLTPLADRLSDGAERVLAGEVTMSGLGLLIGLVVAIIGLTRPGHRAPASFAASVVGSGIGSLLAWGVGRLIGAPVLTATGVLAIWPFTVALVTVVATLVMVLVGPSAD
jgi:hypothetical protein